MPRTFFNLYGTSNNPIKKLLRAKVEDDTVDRTAATNWKFTAGGRFLVKSGPYESSACVQIRGSTRASAMDQLQIIACRNWHGACYYCVFAHLVWSVVFCPAHYTCTYEINIYDLGCVWLDEPVGIKESGHIFYSVWMRFTRRRGGVILDGGVIKKLRGRCCLILSYFDLKLNTLLVYH
jgi:hypothetical protein